ncbi:MAG: hypothetical protein ACP5DX_16250 [Paracoccaceae bacterium]
MNSFDWIPETLLSMEMFCRKNNLHRAVQVLNDAAATIESEIRDLQTANGAPHAAGTNPTGECKARRGEIVPLFVGGANGSNAPDEGG